MHRTRLLLMTAVLAVSGLQFLHAGDQLPRLLDLGADKCIPCKKMAPILAEMKKDFAGVLDVHFIDVWQNPGAGKKYGIEQIPTQIFFDAQGKELFRHVGFFGREEMMAKWKELGYDLKPAGAKLKPAEKDQQAHPVSETKEPPATNSCKGGKCAPK